MKSSQRGYSLIETMIALVIGTIVIAGILTMTRNTLRMQNETRGKLELEELRRYVVRGISCDRTLKPDGNLLPACAAKNYLEVKGGDDRVLIAKPFSKYGAFALRASCKKTGADLDLFIEAMRADKDGNALPDPTSGKAGSWEPLFDYDMSPCTADMPPKEVIVKADLKIDPATMLTLLLSLTGVVPGLPIMACADSEWTDPNWRTETSLLYEGHAYCPRGYTLVDGNANCSLTPDGDPGIDLIPANNSNDPTSPYHAWWRRIATTPLNYPIYDQFILDENLKIGRFANVWYGACCVRVNTLLIEGYNIPLIPLNDRLKDRVYARCVRND